MATKFFLRTKQEKGTASLYTRINRPKFGITNWYLCTKIKVSIESWTKAEKSSKALNNYYSTDEGAAVQKRIAEVEAIIRDYFKECTVSADEAKRELEDSISNVVNEEGIKAKEETEKRQKERKENRLCGIANYYQHFVDGINDGTIRRKREQKLYKKSSVSVWRFFGRYLADYLKLKDAESMTFDQIDKVFADGFVIYLENLGLMSGTINKQIACFRRLCNAAANDSKNRNQISVSVWHEREVKDKEKRAEIALSDAEINALYDMSLAGIREKVRDVWMLGFFSGQRVSDYTRLTRDNFVRSENGVGMITLTQQKTDTEVFVPIIDDRVNEICEKYDYNFPKVNKRDVNRYIKEVLCELAKSVPSLSEIVQTRLTMQEREKEQLFISLEKRIRSGEKLHGDELKYYKRMKAYSVSHESGDLLWKRDKGGGIVKYKWELVGSHTSRRSAVTSLYNTGLLDAKDIMSISGHTTLKNFEGYIRRGAIEQAERIAEKVAKAREVSLMKKEA